MSLVPFSVDTGPPGSRQEITGAHLIQDRPHLMTQFTPTFRVTYQRSP
jgi:hypothetical protein